MKCKKCKKEDKNYNSWAGKMWKCPKCGFMESDMENAVERALWQLLREIPKGRVTTYKILATKLGVHQRVVARMLSKNNPNKYPCYRVVNSNGTLGGYNLGVPEKIKRLESDGIKIVKEKIELEKYLFR